MVGAIALSVSLVAKLPSSQSTKAPTVREVSTTSGVTSRTISVFRSPNCGCCQQWMKHLQKAGFQVQDNIIKDLTPVKQQYGIPEELAACHTATVAGYVIEGHVPAEDIQRLLAENPDLAGLAVPGMPIGSPGMESGDYVEPYTVFSITNAGKTKTFAKHS